MGRSFRFVGRLATVVVLLGACGCQLKPTFDVGYRVEPQSREPVSAHSVVVVPFEDKRPPAGADSEALLFALYLPLWPWISVRKTRIDDTAIDIGERGGWAFSAVSPHVQRITNSEDVRYVNSFPASIAYDLQQSRIFRECTFVRSADNPGSHRYVLSGEILDSEYRVSSTSYFLGMAGVLLWSFGIPMEKVTGEVSLRLVLKEMETGAVVWEREVQGKESSIRTMFGTSAMIHGTGVGAFAFQIQKGSNNDYLDPHSLFWWNFMALRNARRRSSPSSRRSLQSSPRRQERCPSRCT